MPRTLELKILKLLPQCTFSQLKQIHAFIITSSLSQNIQAFSNFLRRASDLGTSYDSDLIFSQMGHEFSNEITIWNVMIRGYVKNGLHEKCILLFDEMPRRKLKPDNYTYPCVLNSCTEMGCYTKGKTVHGQIVKSGFESSIAVANSLFNMYTKMQAFCDSGVARKLSDAGKIFDDMPTRTLLVWNRMIAEHVDIGDLTRARQLFDEMPQRDSVSWNSVISAYARVRNVANARDLFEVMPEKNVVSWTTMIGAYAGVGDLGMARKFFEKMPCRNVVSWNSMISSYTQHRKFEEALNLFVQMQLEGISWDEYTLVSVLSACSGLGALEFGKWIHNLVEDWSRLGVIVRTALVDMYAKCGDIDKAFTLFIKVGKEDVFCWNVMVKSLAIHGRSEDAINIFICMQKMGLNPNHYSFTSALFACSHGGLVEEGQRIFHSMEKDFGINPQLEHYGCLIDLLSRNGQVEKAQLLVKNMPFDPDIAIWGALLGGCRVRNDLRLAEDVRGKGAELELEANEAGVYVLLSNIYASADRWQEALSTRERMDEKKLWKEAGSSSVI